MQYEEYENLVQGIVKDPDKAAITAEALLKEIKADCETRASLEAGVSERDGRIRTLQDTNMQLFMKVTGGTENQEPEEKTADEVLNDLFKEE